jgi:cytochrome-b5 reductase
LTTYAKEQPERFKLQVFVDNDDGSKTAAGTPALNIGKINENDLRKYVMDVDLPVSWWNRFFGKTQREEDVSKKRMMFLVCGPEPYVSSPQNSVTNVDIS